MRRPPRSPRPPASEPLPPFTDSELRGMALHRLGVREYSGRELEQYLLRKVRAREGREAATERLKTLVTELTSEGLISDARYSRVVARHQFHRDKGPMAVARRLGQKGVRIDSREARTLFNEASGMTEQDRIRSIVERRYPRALTEEAERRRAYQALLRRGFSGGAVAEVLLRGKRAPEAPEESTLESAPETAPDFEPET